METEVGFLFVFFLPLLLLLLLIGSITAWRHDIAR
jgi:hypothetical protein